MSTPPTSSSPIAGETFPVSRGRSIGLVVLYILGILLGAVFVILWAIGEAQIGLGLAGIAIAGLCLYLLPDSLKPSVSGEALVLAVDRLQYVRGTNDVIGQIVYTNIKAVSMNQADGQLSLWIELHEPAADGNWWPGGLETMEVIFAQCGHHVVAGKHLPITPQALMAKIESMRHENRM